MVAQLDQFSDLGNDKLAQHRATSLSPVPREPTDRGWISIDKEPHASRVVPNALELETRSGGAGLDGCG